MAVPGPLTAVDEDLAAIEVHVGDFNVDEFADPYGGIEQELHQNLLLHVAAFLDNTP